MGLSTAKSMGRDPMAALARHEATASSLSLSPPTPTLPLPQPRRGGALNPRPAGGGAAMSHFGRSGPPDIRDTFSLLVLNISFRTTADDLFPLFERYGKVVDVFIPRDRRGFAFVRYKYADEAQKAIDRLDGTEKEIIGGEVAAGAEKGMAVIGTGIIDVRAEAKVEAEAEAEAEAEVQVQVLTTKCFSITKASKCFSITKACRLPWLELVNELSLKFGLFRLASQAEPSRLYLKLSQAEPGSARLVSTFHP
nr:unnamed protein product [Digitaria exilis]